MSVQHQWTESEEVCPNCGRPLQALGQVVTCDKCRMGWWRNPSDYQPALVRLSGHSGGGDGVDGYDRYGSRRRYG